MQIDTAAAIDLSKEKKQNESSFSDQMKAYIKHPGSGVLALLTLLGAVLTFALLFFLIGYILVPVCCADGSTGPRAPCPCRSPLRAAPTYWSVSYTHLRLRVRRTHPCTNGLCT